MDEAACPVYHPQVAMTVTDGQAVIVLADTGQVIVLNEMGTYIWSLCSGKKTISQIVQLITQDYQVDLNTAQDDAQGFLQQMLDLGAIVLIDKPT